MTILTNRGSEAAADAATELMNTEPDVKAQILVRAREISQLLEELPALKAFHKAERAYLNDPWIQEALRRQQELQVALSLQPQTDDELNTELLAKLDELDRALESNPRYAKYQAARQQVNKFLTAVMTIVSYPVTGQGPTRGGCSSGGCGSGGCGAR